MDNRMDGIFVFLSIIIAIMIFITPWQIAWRLFIAFLILTYAGWIWWPPITDVHFTHAFSLMFMAMAFFILVILFSIRTVYYFIWGRNNPTFIATSTIHNFNLFLTIAFGLVCGIQILILFGRILSTADYGFIIHIIITILALGLIFFLIRTIWHKRAKKDDDIIDFFFLSYCISLIFTVGILSFSGTFYPWYVIAHAKDIAENNPYCIILEKRKRTAIAREDFTFFTMDKANSRNSHHVTLIIIRNGQQDFYHWSYRFGQFYKNQPYERRYGPYKYHCDPIFQFANELIDFTPRVIPR